jgi:tRNA uridine 5-carboxymethylaminomethyl modification enzyme
MPVEVQEEMVRSLEGFENAVFLKYAYAIEYDAIVTDAYGPTLEIKKWPGLYIAGQICGTSGYEEAAALGLMAGINACLKIEGKEPLVLRRDQAYIGVMIDDLITKGTIEPYRLMSSRAEFRLIMRNDNADLRLTDIGYNVGLISQERYDNFITKRNNIEKAIEVLKSVYLGKRPEVDEYSKSLGYSELKGGIQAFEFLKRIGVSYRKICEFVPELQGIYLDESGIEEVEIIAKYEGYIVKQIKEAKNMIKLEEMKIPTDFDYIHCDGLALEARERLNKIRPLTIGQASRISGVNPADISMLILAVKKVTQHD